MDSAWGAENQTWRLIGSINTIWSSNTRQGQETPPGRERMGEKTCKDASEHVWSGSSVVGGSSLGLEGC